MVELSDLDVPPEEHMLRGVAVTECVQPIPCDPCRHSCPVGAVIMEDINDVPRIDYGKCTGCARCVEVCPGLAMFVVKLDSEWGYVTLPYEFLPLPEKGEVVEALDREGRTVEEGTVVSVRKGGTTPVVRVRVSRENVMVVRNIRVRR